MAQKPTSLASQLADNARKAALANAKEDAKAAGRKTEDGKVWVRLRNAHYDSDGIYHTAGAVVQLNEGQVPSSAKLLTPREAEKQEPAEE